jgi:hypothetical protein
MDLMLFVVILLSGLLIKYLIDIINSLNKEIKEIKDKCIANKGEKLIPNTKNPDELLKTDLISSIQYFKDYFDNKKTYK